MDILIVGRGYAGSILSYFLSLKGVNITIADRNEPGTSTRVSAGIILPVTGRRLAKTFMADTAIPFAISTYKKVEQESGERFFFDKNVLQLFSSHGNKNEWFSRSTDPDLEGYTGEFISSEKLPDSINNDFGGITLKQCGYVDPLSLLSAFRKSCTKTVIEYNGSINYSDIILESSGIVWKNKKYDSVIFCEGYENIKNPWFSFLPFKPAKGEIIDFYSEELNDEYIINGNIFILPLGNGSFRAGSTYKWDDLSDTPTDEGKEELMSSLSKMLKCSYTVTGHKAGIRPAIRDRRPVLGFHPHNTRIGIFNGLGTKGVLLAPYFASMMCEHILNEVQSIAHEFNVSRFNALLSTP